MLLLLHPKMMGIYLYLVLSILSQTKTMIQHSLVEYMK